MFNEKIYLFYTGNVRTENGDRQTYQCLATSEDGITFIKHGPVAVSYTHLDVYKRQYPE